MHFDMLKLVVGCGKIFRGGLFLLRIGRTREILQIETLKKDSANFILAVVQKLRLQDKVERWSLKCPIFVNVHTIENVNAGG